jgi:transcriptional regulator with XRE-family HTH domain
MSQDHVELALELLGCSAKELAIRLGVSPTQISKWKKGEYMSLEMQERLQKLMKIGDMDPSIVRWAGSLKNAKKWDKLFFFLADLAAAGAETGYHTYPLEEGKADGVYSLSWNTVHTLNQLGIKPPKDFPKELETAEDMDDEQIECLHENPYSDLVLKIYAALVDVYGFYTAFVEDLIDDDDEVLGLTNTDADNIEPCLMELAATKIEVDENFAPNFRQFGHEVRNNYTKWLTLVKERGFRAGVPLRAELLDMVHATQGSLSSGAEAESFGLNKTRLHPDIYMNELLTGMRILHQVLPAIMKKLDIYDEFKLDESRLHI